MLEAHTPVLQRSFAFHPHERFSKLSRDVPPIGRGPTFVSGNVNTCHYSAAFASSNILLPHHHGQTLRPAVSRRRAIRGFHVPLAEVCRVRRLLSTGRRMGHERAQPKRCSHLHHRFGSSVKATSAHPN